ncbi:MAG: YlxR family protein [Eubacteriales bacterium]|nr:YlxR family protein [Eubacteriales bacterium]
MPKKIPMRMCVSCREMKPKKELARIVRTPEEKVLLDASGRANGRGAYLCKNRACLEKAVKSRALERALEVKIEPETYDALRAQMMDYEQQAD